MFAEALGLEQYRCLPRCEKKYCGNAFHFSYPGCINLVTHANTKDICISTILTMFRPPSSYEAHMTTFFTFSGAFVFVFSFFLWNLNNNVFTFLKNIQRSNYCMHSVHKLWQQESFNSTDFTTNTQVKLLFFFIVQLFAQLCAISDSSFLQYMKLEYYC